MNTFLELLKLADSVSFMGIGGTINRVGELASAPQVVPDAVIKALGIGA